MRRSTAAALLSLVLVIGSSSAVSAGSSPTGDVSSGPPDTPEAAPAWAVEPGGDGERSWFVYQLRPGQTLQDTVAIENPTDEALTFDLYPVDAFNTEDVGAFALEEADQETDDVGAWIDVEPRRLTVDAGRRVEVPFSVTVPSDASPGDHAGGLVAANTEVEDVVTVDGATLSLKRRIGARIYVRVEGPLSPALEVTQLAIDAESALLPLPGGRSEIRYSVENVGNVRLTPSARIELSGLFGHSLGQVAARQLPELLPGSSITITESLDGGVWPLDRPGAKLTISANDVVVERTTHEWTVSTGLLVLLALVAAGELTRRIRRRRQDNSDDVVDIRPDERELVDA